MTVYGLAIVFEINPLLVNDCINPLTYSFHFYINMKNFLFNPNFWILFIELFLMKEMQLPCPYLR
jgi:hypothetical protein